MTGISGYLTGIEPLNGMNFSSWKDQVKIALGMSDLDYALRFDRPPTLTDTSTIEEKRAMEQWERSNRMSLMIIKNSISIAIRGAIPDSDNAKVYLDHVEEQFKGSSKTNASTLILKMLTTKYDGVSGVREHILKMNDMANKLKSMDMEISEGFLVHFIMTSLLSRFEAFKINYNTQKEKWQMSDLIAMCVQEEERLKFEKPDVAHLTSSNPKKRKFSFKDKKGESSSFNKARKAETNVGSSKGTSKANLKCKFCKVKGHFQRECSKFKEWLIKKGNLSSLMIYESYTITVPKNTWWIDSGSMIHVSNSQQGFLTKKTLGRNQRTIKVGNGKDLEVEAIGSMLLILDSGFKLILEDVLYVPKITRNLISVSKLTDLNYGFLFECNKVTITLDSRIVGHGCLEGSLYKLLLDNQFSESLCMNVNQTKLKRKRDHEVSARLWHSRLGHISRERMQRLVKDEILNDLDFSDLNQFVGCMKGKMSNSNKKGAIRSSGLLELIHTDICGPFPISITGHRSFITFIDDHSRYMYLFPIHEKSESLDMFKIYKAEVENQLGRKIKVVRSDRGGEYYGRHTDTGQSPGPFVEFCKKHGIVNQFTMPGTPQQNSVAERRNRTLMDMLRSMISNSNLPTYGLRL